MAKPKKKPQPETTANIIDDAMSAIERDNNQIKDVCPKYTPVKRLRPIYWAN